MWVSESWVLRMFGPKGEGASDEATEQCTMRSFIICTLDPNIIGLIQWRKMKEWGYVANTDREKFIERVSQRP
jgi:hypothetical protein